MANILLIEDRPNQRLLYQMELEDEGYQVATTSNGLEALKIARKEPFDLILFDPCAPGLSRERILENVANFHTDIPTIIYSACETFQRHSPCTVDACLLKSSNMDSLKQEIHCLLIEKGAIPMDIPAPFKSKEMK